MKLAWECSASDCIDDPQATRLSSRHACLDPTDLQTGRQADLRRLTNDMCYMQASQKLIPRTTGKNSTFAGLLSTA